MESSEFGKREIELFLEWAECALYFDDWTAEDKKLVEKLKAIRNEN